MGLGPSFPPSTSWIPSPGVTSLFIVILLLFSSHLVPVLIHIACLVSAGTGVAHATCYVTTSQEPSHHHFILEPIHKIGRTLILPPPSWGEDHGQGLLCSRTVIYWDMWIWGTWDVQHLRGGGKGSFRGSFSGMGNLTALGRGSYFQWCYIAFIKVIVDGIEWTLQLVVMEIKI